MLKWPWSKKKEADRRLYRVNYCENGISYYTPAIACSKKEAMEIVLKGLKGCHCSVTKIEEVKR